MTPERLQTGNLLWPQRRGYAMALLGVTLATVLATLLRPLLAAPDVVMLYLLPIMVVAVRGQRGPALLTSALSVAAYDFWFVPPYWTFAVDDARHLLTFATFFAVGLAMNGLVARVRREEQRAGEAEVRAKSEELRSALLSSVSHDLRTPLAVITGAGTTLRDQSAFLSQAQQKDLLETICEEADRLERLVVNLLDMTRLAAGHMEARREWIPLVELVGSALTRVESQLQERPMHVELPHDLPLLWVDPVLLEQVLVNLLENALKYTPPRSPLEIVALPLPGEVQVDVVDHGPGLSPLEAERVFDQFVRGSHSSANGAGLGLAICRGIVAVHGGTLHVIPTPGGGATFRIRLPLVANPPTGGSNV